MPSHERTDEVGGTEEVEPAGEQTRGYPVQPGAVPGYLRLVDCEVRGDGAEAPLGGEDGVGVGGAGGCGLRVGAGGGGLECCGAGRGLVGFEMRRDGQGEKGGKPWRKDR